jgi:hypothetical protein
MRRRSACFASSFEELKNDHLMKSIGDDKGRSGVSVYDKQWDLMMHRNVSDSNLPRRKVAPRLPAKARRILAQSAETDALLYGCAQPRSRSAAVLSVSSNTISSDSGSGWRRTR